MLHFLICLDEFPILNDGGGQGGTSNCFIGKIFIFEDFLLKLVIVFTLYRYWYQQISVTERKMRNYSVFLPSCWIWKPQWGQLCFCWRQQSDCTELNYLHRQKTQQKNKDKISARCRGTVVVILWSLNDRQAYHLKGNNIQ